MTAHFKGCDNLELAPIGTSFTLDANFPEDPEMIKTLMSVYFTHNKSADPNWPLKKRIEIDHLRWSEQMQLCGGAK